MDLTEAFDERRKRGSGALQWLAEQVAANERHGRSVIFAATSFMEEIARLERVLENVHERLGYLDGGEIQPYDGL